jgi:hypothetical protein
MIGEMVRFLTQRHGKRRVRRSVSFENDWGGSAYFNAEDAEFGAEDTEALRIFLTQRHGVGTEGTEESEEECEFGERLG